MNFAVILIVILIGVSSTSASGGSDTPDGVWTAYDNDHHPCIMMKAQVEFTLSYIKDDDSTADATAPITVPSDATTEHSSCSESVFIGSTSIESQVLQLNFPNNEGWSVRMAFTKEENVLGNEPGDYTLYMVNITANYSSMADFFPGTTDHSHTYYSVVDINEPPLISSDEYTKLGDSIVCSTKQGFIINDDPYYGPPAYVRFWNLQMQAFMDGAMVFGKKSLCADDQNDLDLIPIIVSCVLAGLVVFTLIAYLVYRSRLPRDVLNMTETEFEGDEGHHALKDHHDHDNGHANNNHHDNYGYDDEEDRRF